MQIGMQIEIANWGQASQLHIFINFYIRFDQESILFSFAFIFCELVKPDPCSAVPLNKIDARFG